MACACGHAEEEHGHDPKYPGSTACTECEDCIAFEDDGEDEPPVSVPRTGEEGT